MGVPKDWLTKACTQAVRVVSENGHPRHQKSAAARLWRNAGMEFGLPLAPEHNDTLPARTVGFVAASVHYAIAQGHPEPAQSALDAFCSVFAKGAVTKGQATAQTARREVLAGAQMRRRSYLAGNPLVGLSLAHAFLAIDARSVKSVLDGGAPFSDDRITAERTAAVHASAHLARLREDLPADMVRRVYAWQFASLADERAHKSAWLERALAPAEIGEAVTFTADPLGLFRIIAMGAALDGRVSDDEAEALFELGSACGLSTGRAGREQNRALAFYRRHQRQLDPLADAAHASSAIRRTGKASWRALATFMAKNGRAAVAEIKETGDLAVLIARRGAGQTLSADETERMRAQLIDVAKAVPGLAVLTLPGGLFLLPLLARLLPFDILPSAFLEDAGAPFEVFDGPPTESDESPLPPLKESA